MRIRLFIFAAAAFSAASPNPIQDKRPYLILDGLTPAVSISFLSPSWNSTSRPPVAYPAGLAFDPLGYAPFPSRTPLLPCFRP
jgi:hypothetical protein